MSAELEGYSDTSIKSSGLAIRDSRFAICDLRFAIADAFDVKVKKPGVSENLGVSDNFGVSAYGHVRKSFGSNFCSNCRRDFLCADVCGLEALPLGWGEGTVRPNKYLPIHIDGCLWGPSPRKCTASEGYPVAHRGLQPLRRKVSASYGLTDPPHRRISDLR